MSTISVGLMFGILTVGWSALAIGLRGADVLLLTAAMVLWIFHRALLSVRKEREEIDSIRAEYDAIYSKPSRLEELL